MSFWTHEPNRRDDEATVQDADIETAELQAAAAEAGPEDAASIAASIAAEQAEQVRRTTAATVAREPRALARWDAENSAEITADLYGELHRLRANWADGASPIERETEDGWEATGGQVADFCHSPAAAMRQELRDVLQHGGDDPDDAELSLIHISEPTRPY